MKRLKTDLKTRMSSVTLNDLLMIQLESPTVQAFIPDHAITLWHADSVQSRRPCYMDTKHVSSSSDHEITEDEIDSEDDSDMEIGSDRIDQFFAEIEHI